MSECHTPDESSPAAESRKPKLPEWLERWLRDHVRVRLRPLTQLAYARAARNFTEALDCSSPSQVTEEDLGRVVKQWLHEPRSIHRIRADVRSFTMALDWAVARGLVVRNVARAITLPPPPRAQPRWWTPEQVLSLLRATQGHALDGVFALAALLGVRRGEIMGLCWRHLDFEASLIRIEQERVEVPRRRLHLQPPKTRASFRTLVMPARVRSALVHTRTLSDARAARLGRERVPDDFVFLTRTGLALCPSYLHWELNRRIQQLALPRIRFHDLRHSAASWMLSLGLSPRTVADTLGHRNIETTLMIYAHVCLDQKRAAAEAIDAAIAAHEAGRAGRT
jgi:integrase